VSRAAGRVHETAVRRALGAGRLRLVRQWLTESVLLGLLGGSLGVLAAYWAAPWLQSFFPSGSGRAALNMTVLAFSVAITVGASLIFGLAPALLAGRSEALAGLRSNARGSTERRMHGTSESFVVVQ